jgi:hypothetical protein
MVARQPTAGVQAVYVVPWKQRLGYATRALAQLLPEARSVGLPFVDITTEPENIASQRGRAGRGLKASFQVDSPSTRGPWWPLMLLLSGLLSLTGCVHAPRKGSEQVPPGASSVRYSMDWNRESRIELPLMIDDSGMLRVALRRDGEEIEAIVDSAAAFPVVKPSAVGAAVLAVGDLLPLNGRKKQAIRGLELQFGPAVLTTDAAVSEFPGDSPLIIGFPLFMSSVVEMDFESGTLTLIRPAAFKPPQAKATGVKRSESLATLDARINGRDEPICAIVDTGYNSGFALPAAIVEKFGLPEDSRRNIVALGANNLRYEAKGLKPLAEVQFGDQRQTEVPADPLPPGFGQDCGVLGLSVLSRYRLVFDLGNDRIWFLPRR